MRERSPAGGNEVPRLPEFNQDWQGYDPRVLAATRDVLLRIGVFNDNDAREDADSVYVARALDYQIARNLQVIRAQSEADQLVPMSREIPPGTETVSWTLFDAVGMAKIISASADDLPLVEVRGREMSTKVQALGVAYRYTRKEIRNAIRSGSNLPQRKADTARAAMAQREQAIKVRGSSAYGMYGILNHPNMPVVAPTTGNWSAAATTAEQMRDDFINLVSAIPIQSKNQFRAVRVGMPYQLRIAATRKYQAGGTGRTAYEMMQDTFPGVTIVEVADLAGAGAGGTHAMVATTFNIQHGAYESVMDFVEYPPQQRNLELMVPCEAETAGFINYQPLAHAKMEGL